MNKQIKWLLAVLLAFAMVAAACGDDDTTAPNDDVETPTDSDAPPSDETPTDPPADDPGTPVAGGDLNIAVVADSLSWWAPDIGWTAAGGLLVGRTIYETFTRQTAAGEVVLELAESLEPKTDDFMEWTMTLRPGITFHDGTPLDAQAVVDIFELRQNAKNYAPQGVSHGTVVDELTVDLTLFAPDPALGHYLSSQPGAVFSPTAARLGLLDPGPGVDGEQTFVGTGPFVFDSWTRDSELTVVRNDSYWRTDQAPLLDSITFKFIPDVDARHSSLRAGDVDISAELDAAGVASFVEEGKLAYTSAGDDSKTIVFNVRIPPLDDQRVRRSLAHALDPANLEAIAPEVPGQEFRVRTQFYDVGHIYNAPGADDAYASFDLAMAQALHDEYRDDPNRSDGKAPGEPIDIVYQCSQDPILFVDAQLFQAQWNAIGYNATVEQLDQAVLLGNFVGAPTDEPPFTGTVPASCFAESGTGDPLSNYTLFYGNPDFTPVNVTNLHTPEMAAALATLASTADVDERREAVGQMERVLAQEMPRVYSSSTIRAVLTDTNVKGFLDWTYADGTPGEVLPGSDVFFQAIWLDG